MPAKNATVAALVPKSIKSKGTLTVATDATYAPDEFIGSNGHTIIGMDADLSHALGAVMGLKVNLVNATFATIIPGLAAGKYDMGASSFGDTKAREKTVDFVDYAFVGESFYTKASGGTSIGSIADICGKTVSVESGTTEEADAKTQSGKCTKAGKPGVKVLVFDTQTEANLAVSSGRAQLGFADTPVATYQVKKSNGAFKVVGARICPCPIRPRDAQERPRQVGAGSGQGPGKGRHLRQDLQQMGPQRDRNPHLEGQDQRRHELAESATLRIRGERSRTD